MLFNSLEFAAFFAAVYAAYLLLPHRAQNRLLLFASYFFYGCWDWRFLSLIALSTAVDFAVARKIHASSSPSARKRLLAASLAVNLGVLGFFKYFDFFVGSAEALLSSLGFEPGLFRLRVVLPVGISFYTFQSMSYSIDVYRRQLAPARNFFDYALFVSLFTQLVAGPIERASHLLGQIASPRTVSWPKIRAGAWLFFWGLFKKTVVGDNVAVLADQAFSGAAGGSAASVLLGVYAFALQIYCDFSAYSDMARGLGMLMGFDISVNFRNPYFALDPSDFWRRWHVSLSSWLRDYLYVPLGGNRKGPRRTYLNLMLTMVLGGLWHGAAWTFVAWGLYHGLLLVAHRWIEKILPPLAGRGWKLLKIAVFFHLICISWLLFRADTFRQAGDLLLALLTGWSALPPLAVWRPAAFALAFYGLPLLAMEIWQYKSGDPLVALKAPRAVRALLYLALFYGLAIFGETHAQSFIYFQF